MPWARISPGIPPPPATSGRVSLGLFFQVFTVHVEDALGQLRVLDAARQQQCTDQRRHDDDAPVGSVLTLEVVFDLIQSSLKHGIRCRAGLATQAQFRRNGQQRAAFVR